MGDLISRKKAIEALASAKDQWNIADPTYASVRNILEKRSLNIITNELFNYLMDRVFVYCDTDSVKYIGGDNNGCRP